MVKWTEVSAYSGMPVDEDAPTVHTGPAIAGTGDDSSVVVMKKKKKKTLIDARTKTYKEHQRRLQLARERREERKKKAAEKINEEQINEVNVTFIKKFAADMKKDKQFKPYADKFMKLAMKGGSPRDALEKAVPDFIAGKDIEKLISKNRMSNIFGEEQISEMKKVEIKLHPRNIDKTIQKIVKHIGIENRGRGTKIQVIQNMSDDSVTLDGRGADVGRQVKDIRNFIGFKSAKVIEDIQPKTFTQKVQEQISGFAREPFLAENNMNVIKSIVKSQGAKNIKMKDGSLKMDYYTASAISKVYDKVNPANKKRMENLANGRKADLMKLQALAMKFVK
tara:strand:- start:3662 stop:4669 length:1008 start_codon:yes stop_codon:yes gene_type:complete